MVMLAYWLWSGFLWSHTLPPAFRRGRRQMCCNALPRQLFALHPPYHSCFGSRLRSHQLRTQDYKRLSTFSSGRCIVYIALSSCQV